MAFYQTSDWHEGEKAIHKRTRVEYNDNPTSPFLYPRAANQVARYPLMAFGVLDGNDRPWCTVWGSGEPPIAQAIGQSVLGIRATVDASFDPVVQIIYQGKDDGEVLHVEGQSRLMSGLSISLEVRGRVKLAGNIIAGSLNATTPSEADSKGSDDAGKPGQIQLVSQITQTLPNCPKYLNKKRIVSSTPEPRLLSTSCHLSDAAIDIIHKADLFFLTSAHAHEDMDCNHRGGPPGFVRVQQPHESAAPSTIVWPEYSGNNLYQTLGNLETTPRAGLVFPDFETGSVLYVTGDTETLVGPDAASMIAKSHLAVRLSITDARLVETGLPFRGIPIDDATQGRSPYNPRVRYLTTEKADALSKSANEEPPTTAQLVRKNKLTPSITRYRFALSDPATFGPWKPGQYVAMDLSAELNMGYSHMRDDDPTSLNDDFIRTFTVSSVPNTLGIHGEEFEITVRRIGNVTAWLEYQRAGMCEIGIRGFGGEFLFDQANGKRVGFVAAGIGITPLLGQMGGLDLSRLKIWWSVGIRDVGLPLDILSQHPDLKSCLTVFLTGDEALLCSEEEKGKLQQLIDLGVMIKRRRIQQSDLSDAEKDVDHWYLCTAPAMRKIIQQWMPGKSFVFENFDY
ncbi:hypothetical protein LTS13_004122 [Exophiala xenobiotica]|nr:hypothetical protein LTS13_004122 [Exophiala xenobiotica]KAK5391925.1 hypothetical protein LTR79_010723 [Exophiala xenobiotica]KAK5411511.1 hypothetical protein LTR90_007885 [Exophiala xenobiotica]KAK5483527.1 hypothetical protein LTR26_005960 [Exophiala xenobiotica]KAK5494794.1 hypothetical protein LTR83_005190 [Exophiala xenobiotica]